MILAILLKASRAASFTCSTANLFWGLMLQLTELLPFCLRNVLPGLRMFVVDDVAKSWHHLVAMPLSSSAVQYTSISQNRVFCYLWFPACGRHAPRRSLAQLVIDASSSMLPNLVRHLSGHVCTS